MPKPSVCPTRTTQDDCKGSCYWNAAESKCEPGARKLLHPKMPSPPRAPTAWMDHVAAYRAAHPGVSYKDALVGAKATYTAQPKAAKAATRSRAPSASRSRSKTPRGRSVGPMHGTRVSQGRDRAAVARQQSAERAALYSKAAFSPRA